MDLFAVSDVLYTWFAEELRFVRLLLLAVAAWLTLDVAMKLRRDARLKRGGAPAVGRVAKISSGENYDTAIISFIDGSGRTREFDSELPYGRGTGAVGDSFDVLYDPNNPRRAHIAGKPIGRAWLYAVSLITAAGIVFLAVVTGW